MDPAGRARFEARARIARALGHPSRLAMVEELSRGERCVCELRDLVGADLSTVSRHLTLLKNAGIVEDDKRGVRVFYRLKTHGALHCLGCIEAALQNRARKPRKVVR